MVKVKDLAFLAVAVLATAIFGGPIAIALTRIKARTKATAYFLRAVITLISLLTILMGFALTMSTFNLGIRAVGAIGLLCACFALFQTFKRRPERWR